MTQTVNQTDHRLATSIVAELAWTPSVVADHIGVAVNDGAVTLSGQVMTLPEKEAAVNAALRVRGVRAIVDDVVVQHAGAPREDADIAREATTALDQSVVLSHTAVRASVKNRSITLTGQLTWEYQRSAARAAVVHLPGVVAVVNAITLKPTGPVDLASSAAEEITAALVRNARLDAAHIRVSAFGDRVTLSGTVSSWAERREAELGAWFCPGVVTVDNQITVRP